MGSFNRRFSKGASLTSLYILETGLGQNAPSASIRPALLMRSNCCRLVLDALLCTKHYILAWIEQWFGTCISSASLPPPHFKCATTRMRLRASLHWVLCTDARVEGNVRIPPQPKEFCWFFNWQQCDADPDSGGLWTLYRVTVKCTTWNLLAWNLKPSLVAYSCMTLTSCCKCIIHWKQIVRSVNRVLWNYP